MNFDLKNMMTYEEMHQKSPKLPKDLILKPYEQKSNDIPKDFVDNQTLNQTYFDL
tara:strand:- start:148 stop:312 length:165 start_codon:yes stop_codon:yes gene_type:complete